jgi:hypothetical protein
MTNIVILSSMNTVTDKKSEGQAAARKMWAKMYCAKPVYGLVVFMVAPRITD